jgi:copper chaperone
MAIVKIKGMSCQHCVNATFKALDGIEGVSNVQVDLDKGEASFDGDVSSEQVKEAIAKIGFEVVG